MAAVSVTSRGWIEAITPSQTFHQRSLPATERRSAGACGRRLGTAGCSGSGCWASTTWARASKFAEFVAWKVNTKIWRIMLIGLELYVPSKVQKAVKNKADLALKE